MDKATRSAEQRDLELAPKPPFKRGNTCDQRDRVREVLGRCSLGTPIPVRCNNSNTTMGIVAWRILILRSTSTIFKNTCIRTAAAVWSGMQAPAVINLTSWPLIIA